MPSALDHFWFLFIFFSVRNSDLSFCLFLFLTSNRWRIILWSKYSILFRIFFWRIQSFLPNSFSTYFFFCSLAFFAATAIRLVQSWQGISFFLHFRLNLDFSASFFAILVKSISSNKHTFSISRFQLKINLRNLNEMHFVVCTGSNSKFLPSFCFFLVEF